MPYCSKCGSALSQVGEFCANCGSNQGASQLPASPSPKLAVDREQIAVASQIATGAAAAMQFQTAVQRQCPHCSHNMIVVFRKARSPYIVLTVGFLMLLIPIFGWILGPFVIVAGFILLFVRKGKARYQCPNCNYAT